MGISKTPAFRSSPQTDAFWHKRGLQWPSIPTFPPTHTPLLTPKFARVQVKKSIRRMDTPPRRFLSFTRFTKDTLCETSSYQVFPERFALNITNGSDYFFIGPEREDFDKRSFDVRVLGNRSISLDEKVTYSNSVAPRSGAWIETESEMRLIETRGREDPKDLQ